MGEEPRAALDRVLAHQVVRRLECALTARTPVRAPLGEETVRRAAVALILRAGDADALELLLIRRAAYAGDPWSGPIALPGGREEPGDASLAATAMRETCEETAIDLARDGRIIGQLDDVQPRTAVLPRIIITPFVAVLGAPARPSLTLSPEVADAFWVPLAVLRAPHAATEVVLDLAGGPRRVRCFQYGGHIIWGLTERILRQFLELVASSDDGGNGE
jgi:8-oxo-dGTP pyrophosphatase MutT (NUDIX family)